MEISVCPIVTGPRNGSHLLRSALATHPQVHSFGEIILEKSFKDIVSPSAMLDEAVRQCAEHGKRALVFILHWNQGVWPGVKGYGIWAALHALEHRVKVIRLNRRNSLKQIVSHLTAIKTNVWNEGKRRASGGPDDVSLEILPEWIVQASMFQGWIEKWLDFALPGSPVLAVNYEDCCSKPERTFSEIQRFLELDIRDISPRTRKLADKPLRDRVSNFEELRSHFNGSPYESFFNDTDPEPEV